MKLTGSALPPSRSVICSQRAHPERQVAARGSDIRIEAKTGFAQGLKLAFCRTKFGAILVMMGG